MARTIKRAYARYSESFKAEAVRLASQPGILVQDVAQSLDIHPFMLSRWKKQCREGIIMVNPELHQPNELVSEAELLRLREVDKAYAQLKLEHDLLKKPSNSLPMQNGHLPFHCPKYQRFLGPNDVRAISGIAQWLVCMAKTFRCRTG